MGISARVIADSINVNGERLITVEATFNRWILAELNTHRMLSRNSASSRAIPVSRVLRQVWSDPAVPHSWGANQAGMQARAQLSGWRRWAAKKLFLLARIPAIIIVWMLSKIGLHKQVANRILEPWVWHTAIISATEWSNFFKLRLHPDAQPEFQYLAVCIREAIRESRPQKLKWGEWHLPYITPEDYAAAAVYEGQSDGPYPILALMSAARCAAVSYVRQGEHREIGKDIDLARRLIKSGHWSPFEHVATPADDMTYIGNFKGWKQLRKMFKDEDGRGFW